MCVYLEQYSTEHRRMFTWDDLFQSLISVYNTENLDSVFSYSNHLKSISRTEFCFKMNQKLPCENLMSQNITLTGCAKMRLLQLNMEEKKNSLERFQVLQLLFIKMQRFPAS